MRYHLMKYVHYDVACKLRLLLENGGGPAADALNVPTPVTGRLHGPCHDLVRAAACAPRVR
jgi:hypothetical protein